MSSRSRHLAVLFLTLSLVVIAPISAFAQDAPARVSERLRHKDRLASADLPANTVAAVFTVAPGVTASVRARTAERPPARIRQKGEAPQVPPGAPDPVPQETMDRIAVALGGGAGDRGVRMPGNPVYGNVAFSLRRMGVNEAGDLDAALSYDLDPSAAATQFIKNSAGSMTIRLRVEEGKTYVVDFSVKSSGSGIYRVETSGGSRDFEDNQGQLEHVLVVLEATESGWTEVDIGRMGDSRHWVLEVRVSRIEMA